MTNNDRPLSPHLSIYRWPITMLLSILHRFTGIAMSVGLLVFAWWLMALAAGESSFAATMEILCSPIGRIFVIGWSFAFFLHLGNGVRHLFWDVGRGFEISQANASAWFVLLFAIASTALFWVAL